MQRLVLSMAETDSMSFVSGEMKDELLSLLSRVGVSKDIQRESERHITFML